jgi:2-oxoglutarate ferredoxin oxidoreductase subunit alpha
MVKNVTKLSRVVIRFAGDSGDGMQLIGGRFTSESAILGNDLATLASFPAEIRAPAGTLAGVSGFQLQFADHAVSTPGDTPSVLVAMNPAALRANLADLPAGADLIVDTDQFGTRALRKVGYQADPLTDGSLAGYRVHGLPMTRTTVEALAGAGVSRQVAERARNMFALGLVCWLYQRPTDSTEAFLRQRFAAAPAVAEANLAALRAGWNYGETAEAFAAPYEVAPAPRAPGVYRTISGNTATAWGLLAAAAGCGLPLFLGSYPITPASDILHELARRRDLGVLTFQAEDEIAAAGAALGAAYGGHLGVTATSGPGMSLKSETLGLAVMLELPMVVIDVQRAGPSTGMPTKPEQSDLLMAMHGRHGDAPLPVLAARSPADCFDTVIEAARIATTARVPVIVLSDAFLANGTEPWRIPEEDELPRWSVEFATEPNHEDRFWPYLRDPDTLARGWAIPGTPGLEHRVGGLEKADGSGEISYDGANHERMVGLRRAKVEAIARTLPAPEVDDPSGGADTLVVSWGSTYGPAAAAVADLRASGQPVAHLNLRHLSPFPPGLGALLAGYRRVVVPELNTGQLASLLRAAFLLEVVSIQSVAGRPFTAGELARSLTTAVAA